MIVTECVNINHVDLVYMLRVHSRPMDTVDDVFKAFGGPTALARAIGVKVSAASEMRRRCSIPVGYWPLLVMAAKDSGVPGINYDRLVAIHQEAAKALSRQPAQPERAAS